MARKPIVKIRKSPEQKKARTAANKLFAKARHIRLAIKDALTFHKRGRYARRHPNG